MLKTGLKVTISLMLIASFSIPLTATAQPVDQTSETQSQFVDMEQMLLSSAFKKRYMQRVQVDKLSDFGRLLRLKKSFLPKVKQSAQSNAL